MELEKINQKFIDLINLGQVGNNSFLEQIHSNWQLNIEFQAFLSLSLHPIVFSCIP
jgi:hypothetical protein